MTTTQIIGLLIVAIILHIAWVVNQFEDALWFDDETQRFYTDEQYKALQDEKK